MSRFKTSFVCSSCGYKSVVQMGRCPECGEWNSFIEEIEEKTNTRIHEYTNSGKKGEMHKPVKIREIKQESVGRASTGFVEVDRVLGGGLVGGSVILLAGEPGVGKSTLLLQIAKKLSSSSQNSVFSSQLSEFSSPVIGQSVIKKTEKLKTEKPNSENRQPKTENREPKVILYVSGEESEGQIAIRFQRLQEKKGNQGNHDNLLILNETNVDFIIKNIELVSPSLIIVDSIQTIFTEDLSGTAGSVGQVRECAFRLSNCAKSLNIPLFLVGQITKEGAIAGPKVLEHLVDVVLYFEGERFQNLRLLRGVKNRFGPVDEAGVFEMRDGGLKEVENPSQLFLGEEGNRQERQPEKRKAGAIVMCTLEGTRPLLAEIQALCVWTPNPLPRRIFSGLDFNRGQVILAVAQKYLHLDLSKLDVYVAVSGGLKITEPAADLAIALAVYSAVKNIAFDAVCFGEIGLLGDVRVVNNMDLRAKECRRLGFKKVLSAKELKNIKEVQNINK